MAAQGRRKDRIAILASGAGSNAEAILAHFEGQAAAEVAEVVWVCTNREGAGVRQMATKFGWKKATLPSLMWRTVGCLKVSNRGRWIGLCSLGTC